MSESSWSSSQSDGRMAYPSDVTDRQWEEIELLLTGGSKRGRRRKHPLREIVNAINYRWLSGCSWRMLPHDLPHWQTVYSYFRRCQRAGLLAPLREILLSRSLRISRPTHSSSRPSERISEQPAAVSPASRRLPATSVSEWDTSSWPAQSSYTNSRS